MFTFKKVALVGIAALTAFSISCSDDDKGDSTPKLIIPEGYDASKVVTLGGTSSKEGSFLDADGVISVSTLDEATINKIDLVFDGTNLFTVSFYDTDAGASALGSAKLKGADDVALLWEYSGEEDPQSIVDFIYTKVDANGNTTGDKANVSPVAGKAYAVFTTDGYFAIVKINSVSAKALVASVGNFDVK